MDAPVAPPNPFVGLHGCHFATILADPPWLFTNKTGKIAPEHRRLYRYETMTLDQITALPVGQLGAVHLYLWCPNALLPDGLAVMAAWGFTYKTLSDLVQNSQRRRPRRPRCRLLLPQRDRAGLVRYARSKRPHARAGAAASKPAGDAQA